MDPSGIDLSLCQSRQSVVGLGKLVSAVEKIGMSLLDFTGKS